MPVYMLHFAADGEFPTVRLNRENLPHAAIFHMQCQQCGYEAGELVEIPRHHCPKCYSHAWKRMICPGSLLRMHGAASGGMVGKPTRRSRLPLIPANGEPVIFGPMDHDC